MKRRQLLYGTTALFSAPIFGGAYRKLVQDAVAQDAIRRPKYILYNHANSLQRQKIRESSWSRENGWNLKGILEPFQAHTSDLTVVESLYCSASRYQHGNNSSAMSCASRGARSLGAAGGAPKIVGGITIDQVIANQISVPGEDGVRLKGLALGLPINLRDSDCVYGTILGTGDNEPLFPKTNALDVYNELFAGAGIQADPRVAARLAARKSQLDHLGSELRAASASLPMAERAKLDLYTTSIRSLEEKIALGEVDLGGGCEQPGEPARQDDGTTRSNDPELWKALIDLGIASLRCGLTRQLSLLHSYGCIHLRYRFNGRNYNHHEEISHEAETGPVMTQILSFHAEHVAYIYSELQASGDADDTVVMWMSDGGGRHHQGAEMYPIVLLGKPGNVLNTGSYVKFDEKKVSLASLHLTVAKSFGSPINEFGDNTDPGKDTISQIMV